MTDQEILGAAMAYTDSHGGGGTSDYDDLDNRPKVNNVTLTGNMSASDLGLASEEDLTGKQDVLTKGQYVDITNKVISVQRDIAKDVDAIIATSFDFPNCTVTKTIDEEVVDTVTFSMFGDIPSSVMDVYSVSFNGQAVALTFTNLVASKEHAVGYAFQVASYSSGVVDTQTFVETVDSDKKLIIQSELNTALADKADKADVKNEFIGTLAEWNAKTTAQKKEYDTYQITDDYSEALLPNYSTTEQKTGQKWIDGKDRYFITVNVGELPNNNVKRVSCPLNIDTLIDIRGVTDKKRVLPYVYIASGYSEFIGMSYTADDQIVISTNQDFSAESAYVTLWYTKTA